MENISQQDIAELENKLAEKRAALEQQKNAGQIETMPQDKEILHEIVGQRIQGQVPDFSPAPAPSTQSIQQGTAPAGDDSFQGQLQQVTDIAFTKGLQEAISIAQNKNDPAFLNALHNILVDQLYDRLVERKIIAKL